MVIKYFLLCYLIKIIYVFSSPDLLAAGAHGSYLPTVPAPGYSYSAPSGHSDNLELDPLARLALNIPGAGVPGVDYPILA